MTEVNILDVTYEAGEDLSAKQFYWVKLSADKTVVRCTAATDVPTGILQNKPTSGQAAVVRKLGRSKNLAGGTITYGQLVGTDADGKGDAKTPGTDTTEYVAGQAESGAAAAELFDVIVNPVPFRAA